MTLGSGIAVWLRYAGAIGAALLLADVLAAQIPLDPPPSRCSGPQLTSRHAKPHAAVPPRRDFSVSASGLCAEYATAGWEATMHLHLGEGADDHLPLVEMAVELWNTALGGFARRPVINIIRDVPPKTSTLETRFWQNGMAQSDSLVDDGQSVIYFKPSGDRKPRGSFAHWRWDNSDRLREADIYINTTHVAQYGPHLIDTHEVLEYDEDQGVFATVDSTYLTVLHELGHALGLNHVAVSGNIMSYNYMPRMEGVWKAPLSMLGVSLGTLGGVLGLDLDAGLEPFLDNRDAMSPYMYLGADQEFDLLLAELYTQSVVLGEQDKMALMCIYEFEDWNHSN